MSEVKKHKSGFVNILGRPNVGKSTLMNRMMGERMSIITSKPQTTRHRILGIFSGEDYQIVFSDTPGVIENPAYEMQSAMNAFAWSVIEDADILLFMVDVWHPLNEDGEPIVTENVLRKLNHVKGSVFLLINKIDQKSEEEIDALKIVWKKQYDWGALIPISAEKGTHVDEIFTQVIAHLPEGPAYYPKEQLTDKNERFFVSEIIREKILLLYRKEIPYSVEVIVHWFKHDKEANIIRIGADIFVERPTQKSIIIGKGGSGIKKLGTLARKEIEEFLQSKVFIEIIVKVKKNWRSDEQQLRRFGYRS